jgi:hypothetical protein
MDRVHKPSDSECYAALLKSLNSTDISPILSRQVALINQKLLKHTVKKYATTELTNGQTDILSLHLQPGYSTLSLYLEYIFSKLTMR